MGSQESIRPALTGRWSPARPPEASGGRVAGHGSPVAIHGSPVAGHGSLVAGHWAPRLRPGAFCREAESKGVRRGGKGRMLCRQPCAEHKQTPRFLSARRTSSSHNSQNFSPEVIERCLDRERQLGEEQPTLIPGLLTSRLWRGQSPPQSRTRKL